MRYAPRAILAGGLGFAVSLLAACGGGSGLLSSDQSLGLSGQADQISSAVSAGNCGAAANASQALDREVQTLPVTLDPTLRNDLSQGASTIAELAGKDCRQHVASTPSTPTTSSSTSTTSSSTSTSSTSTTTPTTTSSTSTSTTATTPPNTGTSSTTTGGVGLGGGTTTSGGNGTSGGTGTGSGTTSGAGGG